MRKLFVTLAVAVLLGFGAGRAWADIQDSPIGARVECMDGKYSTSTGRGTCSHHGGIKRYLTAEEKTGGATTRASASSRPAGRRTTSTTRISRGTRDNAQVSPAFAADPPTGGDISGGATSMDTFSETSVTTTGGAPRTGGSPMLMSLIGCLIAGGALGARRKLK